MFKKRTITSILILLMLVLSNSCAVFDQKLAFYNDKILTNQNDNYTTDKYIGSGDLSSLKCNISSFTGMRTVMKFSSTGEEIDIDYKVNISKGKFRAVLITADNKVTEIYSESGENTRTLKISEGVNRIKFTGIDSTVEFSFDVYGENISYIKP